MIVLEELEKLGGKVEFLDRPMNEDPHDRLLLQIRGAVAEYERTQRVPGRGRQLKYCAGTLLPWSRTPYSYRLSPDQPCDLAGVYLDENEANLVRQLFESHLVFAPIVLATSTSKDEDSGVRISAIGALYVLGSREVPMELIQLLEDLDYEVRTRTERVIKRWGS